MLSCVYVHSTHVRRNICKQTHTHTYIYIYIYMHVLISPCMSGIYTYMCVYIYIYTCTHMYIYIHIHLASYRTHYGDIYIYIRICTCRYVYMQVTDFMYTSKKCFTSQNKTLWPIRRSKSPGKKGFTSRINLVSGPISALKIPGKTPQGEK